ncbi:MAG: hypothetical protein ACXVEF_26870 [Polyangiales bacterium]
MQFERARPWLFSCAAIACALVSPTEGGAAVVAKVPIECTHGPSGQTFRATVTMPQEIAQGATFTVRIDATPSGTISHTGLNYIHDMTTDYLVPPGTTYVPGSLRILPNTGTANVATTARVGKVGNILRLTLPAHVENDSSYTPPSIELKLQATGAAGSKIGFQFWQYRVSANAIFVGDVDTTCTPKPQAYTIATTTVTAPTP